MTQPTFPLVWEGSVLSTFGVTHDIRDRSSRFDARICPGNGTTVVRLDGELDIAVGLKVQAALGWAVAHGDPTVVIDVSRVTFIDAYTIGLIMDARASALERGATLGVLGAEGVVAHLFDVLGLGDLVVAAAGADLAEGDLDGRR